MSRTQHFATKAWVMFIAFAVFGIAITVRIAMVQLDPAHAAGNAMLPQLQTIEPERGRILSADGHLLATSVPRFDLHWDPTVIDTPEERADFTADLPELAAALAAEFQGRTATDWRNDLLDAYEDGTRQYVPIARNIAWDRRQTIEAFPWIQGKSRNRSGFMFSEVPRRNQPFSPLASRTVGLHRPQGNSVGLEEAYDSVLSGHSGERWMRRIHGNYWIPATDDFVRSPEPGLDVRTTLDLRTQDVATDALRSQLEHHEAEWGCAVVLEVATGNVVAIANLSRDTVTGRCSESYNHALAKPIEPGSTFKLASVMAMLETGRIQPQDTIDTGKGFYVPSRGCAKMTDTSKPLGGYGVLRLEEVFERSSNVGTAKAVQKVFGDNPQAWLDALHATGIGRALGVELAGEVTPTLHQTTQENTWSSCSLTSMSIGYEVQITPLQLAAFYNAVAADGQLIRPRFAQALVREGEVVQDLPAEILLERIASRPTLSALRDMMKQVCAPGGHGTAESVFRNRPYLVAGKTGTVRAQRPEGGYAQDEHRGSFVGFFPADRPAYTIAVVVERPSKNGYYGGVVAAPVFRAIADHLYGTRPELAGPQGPSLSETPRLPVSMNGNWSTLQALYQELGIPFVIDSTEAGSMPSHVSAKTLDHQVQLSVRNIPETAVPDVRGMSLRDAIQLLERRGLDVSIQGRGTIRKQSLSPGSASTPGQTIVLELS